jgi:hypothetical protein
MGLMTQVGDIVARLEREVALMDSRLKLVESGVANFRDHQAFMKAFVTEYRVEEKNKINTDKKRARIHFTLLGGLITLVVGCAIALFTWVLDGHHAVVSNDTHSQMFDAKIPNVR